MSQSPLAFIEKFAGENFVPRFKRFFVGVVEDFWKDAPLEQSKLGAKIGKWKFARKIFGQGSISPQTMTTTKGPGTSVKSLWHAVPGEISEKMWGDGFVSPGTEVVAEWLTSSLGLSKDMNVLDLSAGLGGRMRSISEKYGVYITGLEPDPPIAARGMEMSVKAGKGKHDAIMAYDPNNFSQTKKYDCIIARETLYRVDDKFRFLAAIAAATKPKAQIAYTDYIVEVEDRDKPAIAAWRAFEKNAMPFSLAEATDAWQRVGFDLRTHEDKTDYYRKEVIGGLKRLAIHLASGVRPDPETKASILKRVQTWVHRVAAMEQGMKFYRLQAIKK